MTEPMLREVPVTEGVDDRELIRQTERLAERLLTDATRRQRRRGRSRVSSHRKPARR